MVAGAESIQDDSTKPLSAYFSRVRQQTVALCRTLAPEDTVVQSMPDVSPTKWHLAHTAWFFERFVLEAHVEGYERFNDAYDFLLNSYYYTAGQMYPRPKRGLLSRPTLAEVLDYRQHVDEAILRLIEARDGDEDFSFLITLGLNHEQQHQELLLTDIKHVLSVNPMLPAFDADLPAASGRTAAELRFRAADGGIVRIGADGSAFCFDNETPRHDALLMEHRVANRLVTNGEFRQFIDDGGYDEPALWLSDGWAAINERGWRRPLYWQEDDAREFTLGGVRELDPHAPVSHVSYYEADAFARWAGARLPSEFEWEHAAAAEPVTGNLFEAGFLHPVPGGDSAQFFGDTWEWTASAYAPYPGFRPLAGSLGEYNGKFMCNQMTVRGGSCATTADHIRPTYRSFFYPDQRWQFFGFRLAKDGGA